MQVRASGQHRQRLVCRIAAQVCAKIQRVTGWFQKPQIGAVGVVHRQQRTMFPAHLCQSGNVRHAAQIVRAGEIDRRRRCRHLRQCPLQCVRRYRAAAERRAALRPQPDDLKIQQGRRIYKRPVYVSGRHHRPGPISAGQRQIQHRPDALAGPLRGVHRPARAEQFPGIGLTAPDDALRFVQAVRALDLGDVQCLTAQKGLSLVAGHVRPDHPGIRVPPDKISNGRFHQPLALAESSATFIMIAHSIRLRNNSQPAS